MILIARHQRSLVLVRSSSRFPASRARECAQIAFYAIAVRRTLIPLWPLAAPKEDRVVAARVKFDATAKGAGRAGAIVALDIAPWSHVARSTKHQA